MEPLDIREAQEIAARNVCAVCGGILTVAWGGAFGIDSYVLRCGEDHRHIGYIKARNKQQSYRLHVAKVLGGEQVDSTALMLMSGEEMETRIQNAARQFGFSLDAYGMPKPLTVVDLAYLSRFCRDYGVDPLLGEVCLFHGRPYIMIDGLRRKAQETGQYAGLRMRPVTDKDTKLALGYQPDDIVYCATVRRMMANSTIAEYERYGAVTQAETKEMSKKDPSRARYPVLSRKPAEMAQNRAERHALRTAFHLEFPGTEEDLPVISAQEAVDAVEIMEVVEASISKGDAPEESQAGTDEGTSLPLFSSTGE